MVYFNLLYRYPFEMELQFIKQKIHTIRGCQVILDFDLAELYEVETRLLKQAVRRNTDRFPDDFMFELSDKEVNNLVSQFVIPSKRKLGGAQPFAFAEQGVAMLSSVLRSEKAIQVNIAIMRAFVAMRNYLLSFTELKQQIAELEARFERDFSDVHEALKWLAKENQARTSEIAILQESDTTTENRRNRKRIGFKKEP